jgi:ferritin-like metal-binding protein YciE
MVGAAPALYRQRRPHDILLPEHGQMTMNSMRELLVHELNDLYSAETQLTKALPDLVSASSAPLLATAFRDHLGQTENHVKRLEECFTLLNEDTKAIKCKGMEGLLKEGAEMAEEEGNPLVRDAGLIGAAQRVEHYEIAAYGTCVELAGVLGEEPVAELLRQTLEEERAADSRLTSIANTDVNPKAMLSAEKAGVS